MLGLGRKDVSEKVRGVGHVAAFQGKVLILLQLCSEMVGKPWS